MFKNQKVNWAVAILALIAFVVVFLFSQTENANAYKDNNTKHEVSQGEWFSLKAGMPRHEVEQILDGPGHPGQKHTRWYKWAYGSVKQIRVVVAYHDNKMENAFLVAKKVNGGSFDVPIKGIDYRTDKSNGEDIKECATTGEFGKLQPGMTRHTVYQIMDGKGELSEPQVRVWPVCDYFLKPGVEAGIYVWFKKQKAHAVYWIQVS